MAYVAMRRITAAGVTYDVGQQVPTAEVDSWLHRDAAMSAGEIRYVADAQLAQFQTDLSAGGGAVTYAERTPGPQRANDRDQVAWGKQVR